MAVGRGFGFSERVLRKRAWQMVTCLKGKALPPEPKRVRPRGADIGEDGPSLEDYLVKGIPAGPGRRQKTSRLSHRSGKRREGKANNNNLAFIVWLRGVARRGGGTHRFFIFSKYFHLTNFRISFSFFRVWWLVCRGRVPSPGSDSL